MIPHAFGRSAEFAEDGASLVSVRRFASILFIAVVMVAGPGARIGHASCNLIPVATRQFPSTLGAVTSPVTAPGKSVELGITTCDSSAGFEPIASSS